VPLEEKRERERRKAGRIAAGFLSWMNTREEEPRHLTLTLSPPRTAAERANNPGQIASFAGRGRPCWRRASLPSKAALIL